MKRILTVLFLLLVEAPAPAVDQDSESEALRSAGLKEPITIAAQVGETDVTCVWDGTKAQCYRTAIQRNSARSVFGPDLTQPEK